MAERSGLLKSNIAKFLLLRACFGACRMNHVLRCLPFQHARLLAEKSSVVVRNALEEIFGSPLPDICFLLACLPVRKGGLGIRNPALVLGPAFIASNFSLRAHKANSQRGFGASWLKPGRASSEYRNTGRD